MRILVIITFFLSSICYGQDNLSVTEVKEFKEGVKKQALSIKTLQSNFEQIKHLDFLTNDVISKGQLYFKDPSKVKWSYVSPFNYEVVFKESSLIVNDNGNTNVIDLSNNKLFKSLNELMVKSIKGDLFDDEMFTIIYAKKNGKYIAEFTPTTKKMKQYIYSFELTFDILTYNVLEVKMNESDVDYTHIIFSNQKLNETIADEVFTIK